MNEAAKENTKKKKKRKRRVKPLSLLLKHKKK